jgi:hypothetical protein
MLSLDGHAGVGDYGNVKLGGNRDGDGTDGFTDFVSGGVVNLETGQLTGLAAGTLGRVSGNE